jgi:hypothetical protein
MTDPTRGPGRSGRSVLGPALGDLAVVTAFVLVGRRSHDGGTGLVDFLRIWWPFAVGLAVAGPLTGAWRHPFAGVRFVAMTVVTVAVGMGLRVGVQDRTLQWSFVVVTTLFVLAFGAAWRLVAAGVGRRRARRSVTDPAGAGAPGGPSEHS